MKRKVFAALAIGAIALVSCKKEEPATPAGPGSASVSGVLWANTHLDNDTDAFGFPSAPVYDANENEFAKAGTIVTAVIDSEDLDQTPDPSFTYQELKWTAAVSSTGTYSFTGLPAYNWMIPVELRFNDFEATQESSGGDIDGVNFWLGTQTVWIYDGAVVINPDWAYNY